MLKDHLTGPRLNFTALLLTISAAAACSSGAASQSSTTSAPGPVVTTTASTPTSSPAPSHIGVGFDFVYDTVTSSFTNEQVWIVRHGSAHRIPSGRYWLANPIPSPDGRSLLVTRTPSGAANLGGLDGDVAVIALDGELLHLIPHSGACFPGGWAKGHAVIIACTHNNDTSSWHILTTRLDGSHRHVIAPDDPGDPPSVSPDGTTIAYASGATLYTMPATGGKPTRIAGDTEGGTWSPDSTQLAYAANATSELSLVNTDGSNRHRVAELDWSGDLYMTFSPDGKTLLLGGSSDTPESFAQIGVDDGHLRRLAAPASGGDPQRLP